MAKFGSALIADRFEAQKMVQDEIASAPDLAVAMESIGAMYGIPSSHILVDNNLKNVKIMNEHIICPSNVSAVNNTNKHYCFDFSHSCKYDKPCKNGCKH